MWVVSAKTIYTIQFAKYAFVGICSNGVLYLLYIFLTHAGITPKVAMSLLYALGILQTFVFNKRWTFQYSGGGGSFVRYWLVYLVGYVVNILALVVFVDRLKYPHQLVQAIIIVLLACFIFLLQKRWVFNEL